MEVAYEGWYSKYVILNYSIIVMYTPLLRSIYGTVKMYFLATTYAGHSYYESLGRNRCHCHQHSHIGLHTIPAYVSAMPLFGNISQQCVGDPFYTVENK
jgi:hypothetical protein